MHTNIHTYMHTHTNMKYAGSIYVIEEHSLCKSSHIHISTIHIQQISCTNQLATKTYSDTINTGLITFTKCSVFSYVATASFIYNLAATTRKSQFLNF